MSLAASLTAKSEFEDLPRALVARITNNKPTLSLMLYSRSVLVQTLSAPELSPSAPTQCLVIHSQHLRPVSRTLYCVILRDNILNTSMEMTVYIRCRFRSSTSFFFFYTRTLYLNIIAIRINAKPTNIPLALAIHSCRISGSYWR